jgi:hypothetical protein
MRDYLLGVAMAAGHDPREVREYSLRDLELLAIVDEADSNLGDIL